MRVAPATHTYPEGVTTRAYFNGLLERLARDAERELRQLERQVRRVEREVRRA